MQPKEFMCSMLPQYSHCMYVRRQKMFRVQFDDAFALKSSSSMMIYGRASIFGHGPATQNASNFNTVLVLPFNNRIVQ